MGKLLIYLTMALSKSILEHSVCVDGIYALFSSTNIMEQKFKHIANTMISSKSNCRSFQKSQIVQHPNK